jgi:hypothetical protein
MVNHVSIFLAQVFSSITAGSPPPAATPMPAGQTGNILSEIPWGLIIIVIIAGFIMGAIRKNNPNHITINACAPLIDEDKMEKEKKMIAEEEAGRGKPG